MLILRVAGSLHSIKQGPQSRRALARRARRGRVLIASGTPPFCMPLAKLLPLNYSLLSAAHLQPNSKSPKSRVKPERITRFKQSATPTRHTPFCPFCPSYPVAHPARRTLPRFLALFSFSLSSDVRPHIVRLTKSSLFIQWTA